MNELLQNPYIIKGLKTAALAVVIILLTKLALVLTKRKRKVMEETSFGVKYAAMAFFTIGMLVIWLEGLGPIFTALGIVAAALTIVSKELLLNFLGSFVIFWRELFAIGDRVQVEDHTGDVIDKGLLFFTLLETGRSYSKGHSTGRLVKIPNAMVLTQPVINATRGAGYVWNELCLTITIDSDREVARAMLIEAATQYMEIKKVDPQVVKRAFESKRIYFKEMTPIAYVAPASYGIRMTLRYLCRSRMVRDSEDFIFSTFLDRLPDSGVKLAEEQ
jgi:small-conductance mechanosensitive channel